MKRYKSLNNKGFTLLEIVIVLSIIGVISYFAISITSSMKATGKVATTKSNMEIIAKKAREFYRGHEYLPAATILNFQVDFNDGAGDVHAGVPVGDSALNLEPKFRLDAWGSYLIYNGNVNNPGSTDPGGTDWNGIARDGIEGSLRSYGPDQAPNPPPPNDVGDDIVLKINVSEEAVEIAIAELKVLQTKVLAFDALYEGVDNDGDGIVDEPFFSTSCFRAWPLTGIDCPPLSGLTRDPNCGGATLDQIENANLQNERYGCLLGAINTIIQVYNLSEQFRTDPWNNEYQWGWSNPSKSDQEKTWPAYHTSSPRFHKFFSMGPDGVTRNRLIWDSEPDTIPDNDDDIIP